MISRSFLGGVVSACLAGSILPSLAQSPDVPPPPDQQTYTLHVNSRVVLTDVTVTDSHGNPVRGLTQSDFQLFDDGRPQKLGSFQEHLESPSPEPIAPVKDPNVYSNAAQLNTPSTVNVILIDTTTIRLIDQMYLYEELTKFVNKLPPGEPIAIFNRSGQATLLLQNFTSDHHLLLAAIRRAVPHFQNPDAFYTTGSGTLMQMVAYLDPIPGRKNLLWFSGGSNAFLQLFPLEEPERRIIYDKLEADRIAIYPIDARGLTVSYARYRAQQQLLMQQDADATGGHAYFNSNGLTQIASHLVDTDGTYYTLTYSPDDVTQNGKWHNVKVKLNDSGYQLSYRRGYYDDGRNNLPPAGRSRTALRVDGNTAPESTAQHAKPIIFQARILPAVDAPPTQFAVPPVKPKRGETIYSVHYEIPASDIQPKSVSSNSGTDVVGVAVIAFDHYGTPISRDLHQVTMTIDETRLQSNPNANLTFDERINLPKGEDYLYIVVWDPTTGRLGTLNLPLDVKKQPKQ
jgi:VWFA-related protein